MSRNTRTEYLIGIFLCLAGAALTCAPYLLARELTAPQLQFSGFLLNPQDGFSYLAKMRQGAGGSWLFTLPYAPDPGKGTFLFTYYLFLGHIADWVSLPLIVVLHVARGIAAALMFFVAFIFIRRNLVNPVQRWAAFSIVLVGSGLGWMGIPLGILASDMLIPESIPFLSAYTNAHFALACALLLCLILLLQKENRKWRWSLLGAAAGALLAIIQPFVLLSYAGVGIAWLIWEICLLPRDEAIQFVRAKLWPMGAALCAAAPIGVYDIYVSRSHAEISAWNAQNLTPSPPIYEFLLGLGLPLLFSLIAIGWGRVYKTSHGRLLIAWIFTQGLMVYLPFNLQRRVSLGIFFPLAVLAAQGLSKCVRNARFFPLWASLAILFMIPSNLIVVASGLTSIDREEAQLTLNADEIAAYEWMAQFDAESPLILASPRSGNRIPAYADARVLYGHPFETPDADSQEALVRNLYAEVDSIADVRDLGVNYVLYGPEERRLGSAAWLADLALVWSQGSYAIYKVDP